MLASSHTVEGQCEVLLHTYIKCNGSACIKVQFLLLMYLMAVLFSVQIISTIMIKSYWNSGGGREIMIYTASKQNSADATKTYQVFPSLRNVKCLKFATLL